MRPFAFGLWASASVATLTLTPGVGASDWLVGIAMVLGIMFFFLLIPIAVLFAIAFESSRH